MGHSLEFQWAADKTACSILDKIRAGGRRSLIEDPIDFVRKCPDHLTVQVVGAPPTIVALGEVGLHGGITPVVSEPDITDLLPLTGASSRTSEIS